MDQDSEPQHNNPDTPFVSSLNVMPGQHYPNPARLKVNPKPYTGSSSWREYRSHFERVSRINGWSEDLQLDYLWVNLADSALSYVDSLSPGRTVSYSTLCEALEERYGDTQMAEVFKSELRSRRRQSGESLPAFAQEINRLVQRAYPDMGQQGIEELAIERFREAIPDHEQRMAVFRSKARTMDQAVKAALETESWQVSERSRAPQRIRAFNSQVQRDDENFPAHSSAARSRDDHELEDRLTRKMEELINNLKLEKTAPAPQSDRRAPKCYYCQKLGHFQRDCRKKKADTQRSQSQSGNGQE